MRSPAIGQTFVDRIPFAPICPREDATRSQRLTVEGVYQMHSRTEKCLIADGARNIGQLEGEVGRKDCIFLAVPIKSQSNGYMHFNM